MTCIRGLQPKIIFLECHDYKSTYLCFCIWHLPETDIAFCHANIQTFFAAAEIKMTLFCGRIVPTLSVQLSRLIKAVAFCSFNEFWLWSNGTKQILSFANMTRYLLSIKKKNNYFSHRIKQCAAVTGVRWSSFL